MKTLTLITLALFFSTQAHSATPAELEAATAEVKAFLENTDLARVQTYCGENEAVGCRTLIQRMDKTTKKMTRSFYDTFTAFRDGKHLESVCYLLYDPSSQTYKIYSDLTADGVVKIDQILPANSNVTVTWMDDYPTANNLVLSKLGSPNGLIGTMAFGPNYSFVEGKLVELATLKFIKDIGTIEYNKPKLEKK